MKKINYIIGAFCLMAGFTSCESFLDEHIP